MRKRFEIRIEKSGSNDCRLWKLKPSAAGYGVLSMPMLNGNNPYLPIEPLGNSLTAPYL